MPPKQDETMEQFRTRIKAAATQMARDQIEVVNWIFGTNYESAEQLAKAI